MSKETEEFSVRLDAKTKRQADALFREMGIDLPTACKIFVRQSLLEGGIPFDFLQRFPEGQASGELA